MTVLKGSCRIWRYFSLSGQISIVVVLVFVLMAVLSGGEGGDPRGISSGEPLTPPCRDHILGTDELGADLLEQICLGARVSLAVGLGTALLAGIGGGMAGIYAGYSGGWVDKILMRIIDTMTVLPDLPVIIVVAAFFGPGLQNIIVVLALFSWVFTARIVRSQVLVQKEMGYIKSAELWGAGRWFLIRKHLLPEVSPLIAVSMIRLAGKAIAAEAGLSFLGLGDPASKSWGMIIHHATNFKGIYYTDFWKWWLLYPWIALTVMVASLAFICRDMERIADRRIRGGRIRQPGRVGT